MNAAEIKLDMFRKIDNPSKTDLEKIYNLFLVLLNSIFKYKLSDDEQHAIEEALGESNKGDVYSHEDIIKEARVKYPNLKFK